MLSNLRREAQALLQATPTRRKPALRRSDDPEALLATDLPQIAENTAVEQFAADMAALGWRVWRAGDWLLMDKDVPVPKGVYPADQKGEVGCCVSLLRRHPDGETDKHAIRAVVKAADRGRPTLERLCEQLHAKWAEALRQHQALPSALLPYLCQAYDMTK